MAQTSTQMASDHQTTASRKRHQCKQHTNTFTVKAAKRTQTRPHAKANDQPSTGRHYIPILTTTEQRTKTDDPATPAFVHFLDRKVDANTEDPGVEMCRAHTNPQQTALFGSWGTHGTKEDKHTNARK